MPYHSKKANVFLFSLKLHNKRGLHYKYIASINNFLILNITLSNGLNIV